MTKCTGCPVWDGKNKLGLLKRESVFWIFNYFAMIHIIGGFWILYRVSVFKLIPCLNWALNWLNKISIFIFTFKMSSFQTGDKVLLVKLYFQNGESVTSAIRHFSTIRGIRRKDNEPPFNTVKRMINNFLDTGSVHIEKTKKEKPGWYWYCITNCGGKSFIKLSSDLCEYRHVKIKGSSDFKKIFGAVPFQVPVWKIANRKSKNRKIGILQYFFREIRGR